MSVQPPCWLCTCGMHGSELRHVVHAPVAICSKHLLNESQIRSKRGEHSSRQGPRLADLIEVALAALPEVKTLGPLGVLQKQAGAHFWVIHRQQHAHMSTVLLQIHSHFHRLQQCLAAA